MDTKDYSLGDLLGFFVVAFMFGFYVGSFICMVFFP